MSKAGVAVLFGWPRAAQTAEAVTNSLGELMTGLYRPSAGEHPITPPPELVQGWDGYGKSLNDAAQILATQAAQWGADQELKACCAAIDEVPGGWADSRHLRHVRRPKPPSLKELALADLDTIQTHDRGGYQIADLSNIRRALEQLPDAL